MSQDKGTSVDLPVGQLASEEDAARFNIEPHLVNLMLHEPFYSHILRRVEKVRSSALPTAGVTVRDGEFTMLYNPRFLAALVSLQVRGLLKHECLHLVFKHCTGRKQDPHILWNWATDLAINSLIPEQELPEGGLRPGQALDLSKIEDPAQLEKWKKVSDLIESFPIGLAAEKYMALLRQDPDVRRTIEEQGDPSGEGGQGGSPGPTDDHGGWGELSDEEQQIAEGKIRQAVNEAVKKCDRTGQWGSISGAARESLRALCNNSVNWKKVLHNFCGRSQRANRSRTLK